MHVEGMGSGDDGLTDRDNIREDQTERSNGVYSGVLTPSNSLHPILDYCPN